MAPEPVDVASDLAQLGGPGQPPAAPVDVASDLAQLKAPAPPRVTRHPLPVPPPPKSSPPSALENFARPATEFLGGAYEAGKNLVVGTAQLGADALAEAGLAVSALAGDAPSQKVWSDRLHALQQTFNQDPQTLEAEAGKFFQALVDDQVKKFRADPARYTGGAVLNLATQLLPGQLLRLRKAGKVAEAAVLAKQAAEAEAAAKEHAAVRAATRASIAESQRAPLATAAPPGTLVHEGTQGFRFPEQSPPVSIPADPRKIGQIREPAAIPEEPPASVLTPEAEIARNRAIATSRGLGRFLPPEAYIAETGYVPSTEQMARNRAVAQGQEIARSQGRVLRPGGGALRTPVVGRQEFVESTGRPIEPPPTVTPRPPRGIPREMVEMRGSSGLPDLRAAAEQLARAREIGAEPVRGGTPPPPRRGWLGRLLPGRGEGPPGTWESSVAQALRADAAAHGLFNEMDAFNGETLRQMISRKHALTQAQQRELTDLLHSEQSPLHTGVWPEWVSPELRHDLARDVQDLVRTYQANRVNPIPEEIKTALEKIVGSGEGEVRGPALEPDGRAYDAEGKPWFPRIHLAHAIEGKSIAGYRAFRGKGGPRDFFEIQTPSGERRLVAVGKGNTLLVHDPETGQMVIAGKTAKASGLEGSTVTLDQEAAGLSAGTKVTLHTATPGTLRASGIADYLDHPIWALRQSLKREKWLHSLEEWRKEMTSGTYSDVARLAEDAPAGWVKAPYLGHDWMVHPLMAKTVERIQTMRAGEAKWNLLNNAIVGWSFRAFPWAHHPNILFNWTVAAPMEQALGLAKGTFMATWHEAAREIETMGLKAQRMLELGGGRQHVEARLRQKIEQVLREIAQGPDAKRSLWKRYDDFTHAVPWSIDAKARLQTALLLEKTGIPFDEAVGIANIKMPNYWLPSFWPAKYEQLQPLYDALHRGFTSPFFLFSPYHGSMIGGAWRMLKGDMGARGYQTVFATWAAGQLIDKVLAEPIAHAAHDYWAAKAKQHPGSQEARDAEYQRTRWEAARAHISHPGFGRLMEGVQEGAGLLAGALGTGSPGAVRETVFPAIGKMIAPGVTPGPIGAGINLAAELVRGNIPTHKGLAGALPGLIPFGIPTSLKPEPLAEWVLAKGRFYPRFRLPSEQVAANFEQGGLKEAARQALIDRANRNRILRDAQATMYALHLAAARDLKRAGALPGSPEAYARQQTIHSMRFMPKPGAPQRLTLPHLQPPRP